jgi:hypothetical protein
MTFSNAHHLYGSVISPRQESVGGIVVSIAAFQAVDPGSIPGRRIEFYFFLPPLKSLELFQFSLFPSVNSLRSAVGSASVS